MHVSEGNMSDEEKTRRVLILFGRNVAKLRNARGWTVAELGEQAGFSVESIEQLERGDVSATLEHMRRLAGAFQVPLSELVGMSES